MKRAVPALLTAVLLLAAAAAAVLFYNARLQAEKPLEVQFPVMGTFCTISVYGNEAALNAAHAAGKAEFDRVNAACSLFDPKSELSRLNATAGSREFICSEAMWFLIKRAQKAYVESLGNFDITVKPLMDLWGFYRKRGQEPPSDAEIKSTLDKVGFEKLVLDDARRSIRFSVPGMALDMGGIAKGYAADLAAAAIVRCGIVSGVVDIGGNLRFLPAPPPGRRSYKVAIRDPRHKGKTLPDILEIAPGRAVSTSGDYERFVTLGGKRYGHIISPQSGIPGSVPATSVIADNALDADIFSTSCSLGGRKTADNIRKDYPRTEIIFVELPPEQE